MNVLIPCAGKSSRYGLEKPKYLLTMPNGELMVETAVRPFIKQSNRIFFGVLQEHDKKFHAKSILKKIFPNSRVLILKNVTQGQAETVLKMLQHFKINGSFFVKDSDSYFEPNFNYRSNKNYVSISSAKKLPKIKLYNKSFVEINDQNYITRTSEKEIISEFFSCGGYFFSDSKQFIKTFNLYKKLQISGEFFLSSIIDLMIDSGHIFHPMECRNYLDWGTYQDWIDFRKKTSTYIFDIDGIIFENGSQYWKPKWGENKLFKKSGIMINKLYHAGNYILLVSARPEKYRKITEKQLKRNKIKYNQLVMGVFHGTRILINDYSESNPYPAAKAINTKRNSCDFIDKITDI